MTKKEHVVLVDEEDKEIGILDKSQAHNANTKLHRGVSVFVFNEKNLIIQKRSDKKITWPGFWSNSFCGHPMHNETYEEAAIRRGKFELNINLDKVFFISKYRYNFGFNNIYENEICPIYFAITDELILPNFDEISEYKLINWHEFLYQIKFDIEQFTLWCKEEAIILKNYPSN